MKRKLLLLASALLCIVSVSAVDLPTGYPTSDRSKLSLNAGWRFHLGDPDANYYQTSTPDKSWEEVTVPHTLELTDLALNGFMDDKTQPTFMRKVGWYRKSIFVPKSDKRVYIEFEGVHQITTLWVNGRKVGVHSVGGYTPFNFDITDYVRRGAENQVTILADNRVSKIAPPDPGPFDYIKFSGLYRDLYLVEKNNVHISSNLESMNSGVTITTPSVDYVNGNATIDIRTEVHNQSKKSSKVTLVQRVVDAEGNVILKLSEEATISAGERYRFAQIGGVEDDVKFWDLDYPYLYKVNTTLYDQSGRALDVVDNRLGLRKVEYDYESGFKLNGKNIELIGFNRHQHYAFIGDAMPNSLHYRDMVQFKRMGLNCMRTAHYPHDDEVLRACDELGILVYEEAPTWVSISDEKEWFENQRRAIQAMIRNHKNSPSVIIWGAGINHRGAVAESQFVVKQEDPTRLTASQNSRWTGWQTSNWSDIFANMNYADGIWGREEPLFAMEGRYGPEALASYFRDPMKPGMISWTAHAYYTFHIFKGMDEGMEVRTRLGLMDAFRYPRNDQYYWYPAEMLSEPYIHVVDEWRDSPKMLTIYSNATEVELFVNGKTIGRYRPSRNLKYNGLSHAPIEIMNPRYEDGELKVVGYREGKVVAEEVVYTPTKATKLRLFTEDYGVDMVADGNDIMVVYCEVVDKNGMKIKDFEGEVKFSIKNGDATVVGDEIGTGFNPMKVRNGVACALIRSGKTAREIEVMARCGKFAPATTSFKSVPAETNRIVAEAYEIKDRESIMVDLGGEGQLTQFGWTAWNSKDEHTAVATIRPAVLRNYVAGHTPAATDCSEIVAEGSKSAYKFTLKANSSEGVLRWLGEMNVIGRKNFVYGDGLLCVDKKGLSLTVEGLPVGKYSITTYHHAPRSNTNSMDPNLENLKKESIHKLPYSKSISIEVNGKRTAKGVTPTEGKEQQYSDPTMVTTNFTVKKSGESVTILFKGDDKISGIWLNGFEFARHL